MSEAKKIPVTESEGAPDVPPDRKRVCGIVMPISAMGETYSEEHWRRVRKILQRGIEKAGLTPRLVWDNPEVDVIQSAILQNLYENDVVLCDVSGLNPNVMLETGLRLSTKRPTVIVTDKKDKPPFDISTFGYIDYQHDLEFNAIDNFIDKLAKKIGDVASAYEDGTYKSFVENFTFETVEPSTITVSQDQFIIDKLSELSLAVHRIERRTPARRANAPRTEGRPKRSREEVTKFLIKLPSDDTAKEVEEMIDQIPTVFCIWNDEGDSTYEFSVYKIANSDLRNDHIRERISSIISSYET